jgi:phospholipase C
MTYFLAEEFTICNRWFSAVPTDTIPNRLYSLAGTAGRVTSTSASIDLAEIPALDSIFEQLDPEHWRLFSGSIPLAFAVSPIRTVGLDADRWHTLSEFADFVPKLPKLTWIDPTYYWLDVADGLPRRLAHVDAKFPIPNDDHPPSQTERGQELLRYVYESLTAHPEVWANTVLIVTYDEHGGFFDHVEPPPIYPEELGPDGFTHRGPRVPALIVSPYAARGAVCSEPFDHCSILKFLCDWLGLPKWTPRIASERVASVAAALTKIARSDIPAPSHEIAIPSSGPPVYPHHANLPSLVAAIQKATHDYACEKYEAKFPEAKRLPPGTDMPPFPV